MVMFTKDSVPEGMDLRYDYGPAFWTIVRENVRRAGAVRQPLLHSGTDEGEEGNRNVDATTVTAIHAMKEPDSGIEGQTVICKKQNYDELERALDDVRQILLAERKVLRMWETWRPNVEFWRREKALELAKENKDSRQLEHACHQLKEALALQRKVLVQIQRSRDGLEASIMNVVWPLLDAAGLQVHLERLKRLSGSTAKIQTPKSPGQNTAVQAILRPDHTAGPSNAKTGKRSREEDVIDLTND
jgi:hypothetical protein